MYFAIILQFPQHLNLSILISIKDYPPPHTRGLHVHPGVAALSGGITPAYAGITERIDVTHKRCQDHPRIRGDYFNHPSVLEGASGSPPHTRGLHSRCFSGESLYRITPAYAGITSGLIQHMSMRRDHPRIRGEYIAGINVNQKVLGSPPHSRGLPAVDCFPDRCSSITPAYAGITNSLSRDAISVWDHPHIRGDYIQIKSFMLRRSGSPPHTRGLPAAVPFVNDVGRITPAYAGITRPVNMVSGRD